MTGYAKLHADFSSVSAKVQKEEVYLHPDLKFWT